jgi:hypothetical protein
MKDIFEELLKATINWQEARDHSNLLEASFQGKVVRLRLNHFSEEVLCTLFADGEQQDCDDLPSNWTLPEHRQGARQSANEA